MENCSRCGKTPTVLSVPEADWYFCSVECLTKYTQTKEESIQEAEQMFGKDASYSVR